MVRKPVTRSQSSQSSQSKRVGDKRVLPQIVPVLHSLMGEALAAGDAGAQAMFLEMVGLTVSNIPIQEENVLPEEEAEVIAMALSHSYCDKVEDPYFTKEEFELRSKRVRLSVTETIKRNK